MKKNSSTFIRTRESIPDGLDKQTMTRLLETDRFLYHLAQKFVFVVPVEINDLINESLGEIREFLQADRAYIYLFTQNNQTIQLTHASTASGAPAKIPRHDKVDGEDFAWLMRPLMEKSVINLATSAQLPANAGTIRAIMEVEESKSMLISPMVSHKMTVGFIGVDMTRQNREWSPACEYLVKNCGHIFLGAIERKRSVDLAKQSEQKLRTLFARTEDVVFISSPHDRILEINPAGVRLFGYDSAQEVLALDIKTDLYANPEDRDKFKKILKEKGQVKDYELRLKRKDGREIVVLETTTAVYNEQGNVVAYEGIMRDVSERKQLEHQLFQAQKMESIGLLAGGIAHDFNNILTAINGYAEMSLMTMDPSDNNYKNILNILKGGKRAENLIRHLLAFSRKQMIEPRVIQINQVISELHKMLQRLIGEDIEFKLALNEGMSSIKADPVQIQQILVNLVVNAVHAVKQDTGKNKKKSINILTEQVELDEKFVRKHAGSRTGKYIAIRVKDTGVGMDDTTKQKIFEPFFTTKKDAEGTGLGLSTVYGIVKQNNGGVYVESQQGMGTEFSVYWPITDESKRDETHRDSNVEFGHRSETIMVVEDDNDVRDLACSALRSFGYKIIEAENGRKALEMVKAQNLETKIDVLLSDMVMPEMGGEELAVNMRKLNPSLKIILSSGYTDSQVLSKEASSENGFYFLAKPYSIKNLEKKIRLVIGY